MARFINIALPKDVPSLVNIDHLMRIQPGLFGRTFTSGKDEACTLIFNLAIDIEYDNDEINRHEYKVEVFLPTREIMRRMREELLVV